jgi:hypothetical protein
MAEPTSSGMVGIGVLAALLAALGIAPQPMFWAVIGSTLGMSLAPQTGRLRACVVYACAALSSALLGAYIGQRFLESDKIPIAANAASLLLGAMFHPLLAAATNAVPTIINAVLERFGLKEKQT